jgi:hypothetical protein
MKKQEQPKYKMVHFNLYSLGPIHQGIQAYHSGVELLRKYTTFLNPEASVTQRQMVERWRDYDKTVVILSGGPSSNMQKIWRMVQKLPLPFARFCEEDFYGKMTSIAVLVPEDYAKVYPMRSERKTKASFVDVKLANFYEMMARCGMAR